MKKISVILCSRKKDLDRRLIHNIDKTIGCGYELRIIDNSRSNYSIYEAYNIGIKESKANILVFVHDDILFHTMNWGKILIDVFDQQPKYGLLGIAGSRIKTKIPSGWWDCEKEHKFINVIQHFPDGRTEEQHLGFKDQNIVEGVAIDGVFMAMRRSTGVLFNTRFSGFHGYDLAIGFEVQRNGFKIGILNNVLIEHFSYGTPDRNWLTSIIEVHKFYATILPLSLGNETYMQEVMNCDRLMNRCLEAGKKGSFFYYWFKLFLLKPGSRLHLKNINKIIG